MAKILQGKVVSISMNRTIVVLVERLLPHPLFKKLQKRSKKFKVATNGQKVEIGAIVKIIETRPVAKDKHFALVSDQKQTQSKPSAKKQPTKQVKKEKSS